MERIKESNAMKTVGELKKVLRQRGLLQENTENLKNRQALENDRRCMDSEAKPHMRNQKPIRASTG